MEGSPEGVIKFSYTLLPPAPGAQISVPAELRAVRARLQSLKLIGRDGQGVGYGNISILVQDKDLINKSNYIIISATQTSWLNDCVSPSVWTRLDRAEISLNWVLAVGDRPPSSECLTHVALYRAAEGLSAQVRCVLHVHQAELWQLALHQLPTTDPLAEYGTPAMAFAVHACAQHLLQTEHTGVIVMGGHPEGLLAFGPGPKAAFEALMGAFHRFGVSLG